MKKGAIFSLLTILIAIYSLAAATQTITQDEFLTLLIQRHPLFEKERLSTSIVREGRSVFRGAEDWTLQSNFSVSHEEPAIALSGVTRTDALSYSVGLDRLFWKTGGTFAATFETGYLDNEFSTQLLFPRSFYQNQFSLSYEQPLMKNRGGFLDRLDYDLAAFDIDSADYTALENQEEFLADSAEKFLDWAFITEQKRIFAERLKLSEAEMATVKRKRKAFLVDPVDLIRAEDEVRIARQNLVLAESNWKALQGELAVLVKDDGIYDLTPKFDLYRRVDMVPLTEEVKKLKESARSILALNKNLDRLDLAREGFRETEKPDLSLVTSLKLKEADEEFGDALATDRPDLSVGLNFSYPLGNRAARAEVRRSKLQIQQLESEREELEISLVSGLTSLYIQIVELVKVLDLNREQIESAKERTKEELKLYNQGRVELTFVIQSRDNEERAKLTYAENALTYQKLLIRYRALMDELLPLTGK